MIWRWYAFSFEAMRRSSKSHRTLDCRALPRTPARQQENLDVLDFSLTPAEMTEIAGLKRPNSRVVNPPQHPEWDV